MNKVLLAVALFVFTSGTALAQVGGNESPTDAAPIAYQACGQTVYEGQDETRAVLLTCVRKLKEKVNKNRWYAHVHKYVPDPYYSTRTNASLAGSTEKWARIKLQRARDKRSEHAAWHRHHEYSNVMHYGVSWQVIKNFSCIHHWEGAWNDPNAPYYGGLQMDWSFMRTYGYYNGKLPDGTRVHYKSFVRKWGSADHWPVWAQFVAANNALKAGRGYGPWPVTARRCGLL